MISELLNVENSYRHNSMVEKSMVYHMFKVEAAVETWAGAVLGCWRPAKGLTQKAGCEGGEGDHMK